MMNEWITTKPTPENVKRYVMVWATFYNGDVDRVFCSYARRLWRDSEDVGGVIAWKPYVIPEPYQPSEQKEFYTPLRIGDVVEAIYPFVLACGSGRYSEAMVVSSHPLVLVSINGDMLWQNVNRKDVRYVGGAYLPVWDKATDRWEREQRKNG